MADRGGAAAASRVALMTMPAPPGFTITAHGEACIAVRCEPAPPTIAATTASVRAAHAAIVAAAVPGVVDVVPSPDRITVVADPSGPVTLDALAASIRRILATVRDTPPAGGSRHEIPVHYGGDDGPDLDAVCLRHGIDRETLVRLHTSVDYLVTAIGFVPGFPYLAGLPAALATPRLATPRARVPAGSVGIGGSQTGVYPFATPGGWHIIGRTDVRLFDPSRTPPALMRVGDRVRFTAAGITTAVAVDWRADDAAPSDTDPTPCSGSALRQITVLAPGLHTTVQDLGRPGYRDAGVPLGGAADPVALRLANLVVGNPEAAAAIECTLVGPTLRFDADVTVALCGAACTGLPSGRPVHLPQGTILDLGAAVRGCRGVLAVAGGIDVPVVLGSRSTYAPGGFGGLHGRPLRAGDVLPLGDVVRRTVGTGWSLSPRLAPLPTNTTTLRVIPDDDAARFGAAPWKETYRATTRSDRMGLRLAGPALTGGGAGGVSVAVMPGTVQVPPDGQPIILLADAQTIGGYPVLGQVISADLPLASQLRPGARVRFATVTRDVALAALRRRERGLAACRFALQRHTVPCPAIDLNGDVGEGAGHDAALLPLLTSANIACGGHAGDAATMGEAVALALRHGVGIGAHPGHADPTGFGRRPLPITATEAAALVADQIAALASVAGPALGHVKLHGALYHQVGHDAELATAVARRLADAWPNLVVLAPAGSAFATIARAHGLAVAEEGFADRGYDDDGTLLPRTRAGAQLGPDAAAAQALAIAREHRVHTAGGRARTLHADTLCIHGDGPDPVTCLRAVRRALATAGVAVRGLHAAPATVAESRGRG